MRLAGCARQGGWWFSISAYTSAWECSDRFALQCVLLVAYGQIARDSSLPSKVQITASTRPIQHLTTHTRSQATSLPY